MTRATPIGWHVEASAWILAAMFLLPTVLGAHWSIVPLGVSMIVAGCASLLTRGR